MTVAELFEDHFKLITRFVAGIPLRADNEEKPTVSALVEELASLEQSVEFCNNRAEFDGATFSLALYAVNALIDACVDQVRASARADDSAGWVRRTKDTAVGHNFYHNLERISADLKNPSRNELLEMYCLCIELGFAGDDPELRASATVKAALHESVSRSEAATFPLNWPAAVLPTHDRSIAGHHRTLRFLVAGAAGLYVICMLYLYWLAWIGFPSPGIGQ